MSLKNLLNIKWIGSLFSVKKHFSYLLLSTLLLMACSGRSEVATQMSQMSCMPFQVMYSGEDEIAGWVDFKAKEGVTKEEINEALKTLDLAEFETPYYPYSLQTIQAVKGLFLEKGSDTLPTEEDFLKMLEEENYTDAKLHYIGKLAVAVYFPETLTLQEQSEFSTLLISMGINEDKITWKEISPNPWGSVKVPVGEEAEYINSLQTLDLFDCVVLRVETKLAH